MVKILLKIVNLNKFNEPKLILGIFKMSTLVADVYERVLPLSTEIVETPPFHSILGNSYPPLSE